MLSTNALNKLKALEGFRPAPYWDKKQWSIGYGSYAGSTNKAVTPSLRVTPDTAHAMLLKEVQEKQAELSKLVKVPLTQNQWDALTLFAYNLGSGVLTEKTQYSTTLLQDLNSKNFAQFADRMTHYVFAGGKRDEDLVARRQVEKNLFLQGWAAIKNNPGAVGTAGIVAALLLFFSLNGTAPELQQSIIHFKISSHVIL